MIDFTFYLITDRHQTRGRPLETVVKQALQGGVKAIQLREKDLSAREIYETALAMRKLTNQYKAQLYINDRVDIALAVQADGVHLGRHSMPLAVIKRVGQGKLRIAVSTHNMNEAKEAVLGGADFITFGPVFETPSKKQYGPPVGLEALSNVCQAFAIAVFGLGGIDSPEKVQAVKSAGAYGVSMISAVVGASDVKKAAEKFIKSWENNL
jgi:thiamine-phosphate pyrophosphorylase